MYLGRLSQPRLRHKWPSFRAAIVIFSLEVYHRTPLWEACALRGGICVGLEITGRSRIRSTTVVSTPRGFISVRDSRRSARHPLGWHSPGIRLGIAVEGSRISAAVDVATTPRIMAARSKSKQRVVLWRRGARGSLLWDPSDDTREIKQVRTWTLVDSP